LLIASPATAQIASGCASEATCDETQVGDHAPPEFTPAPQPSLDKTRGKPLPSFVPGVGGMVRYKPGAGVWLAEPAPSTNLYLNGKRDKLSIDMKLGF
jgi:hypothetical protein